MHLFLGKQGLFESEFVFVSCGDFDGNHLKREARDKRFFVPNYLQRWINIKKAFPKHLLSPNDNEKPTDFSKFGALKDLRAKVRGMPDMLDLCGLELEGRHHSGIDDAKNIARVAISLLKKGWEPSQGMI